MSFLFFVAFASSRAMSNSGEPWKWECRVFVTFFQLCYNLQMQVWLHVGWRWNTKVIVW